MKIERRTAKAVGAKRNPKHVWECHKEMIIDFDEPRGIDVTAILHNAEDAIRNLDTDGFGINFRFDRDETIRLFELLQKWMKNNIYGKHGYKEKYSITGEKDGEEKKSGADSGRETDSGTAGENQPAPV